jgi:hypothetical protein
MLCSASDEFELEIEVEYLIISVIVNISTISTTHHQHRLSSFS